MPLEILYEDNHVIAVNKPPGILVQGDRTGNESILDLVKNHIKIRDGKPGNVYLGLPHRLDRPVGGVLILAKTSKALSRLSATFRDGEARKEYWAIVESPPHSPEGDLVDWLKKNSATNSSRRVDASLAGARKAQLHYRLLGKSLHYWLLEVHPQTGRHHQIRVQLAGMGCPIKGDLKYGARRSTSGGGILLHSLKLEIAHPTQNTILTIEAPVPENPIWGAFRKST